MTILHVTGAVRVKTSGSQTSQKTNHVKLCIGSKLNKLDGRIQVLPPVRFLLIGWVLKKSASSGGVVSSLLSRVCFLCGLGQKIVLEGSLFDALFLVSI